MSEGLLSEEEWSDSGQSFEEDFELQDPDSFESEDESNFQVLSGAEVSCFETKRAAEVADMLSLDIGTSRILLKAYHWNSKRLFDEFLEGDALKLVGLEDRDLPLQQMTGTVEKTSSSEACCVICCETYARGFSLACKHRACVNCYKKYLTDKIEAGDIYNIKCLADPDCHLLVKAQDCDAIDSSLSPLFSAKVVKAFVEGHPSSFKFCIRPGCDQIVEMHSSLAVLDLRDYMVKCSCGQEFCFKCKNDWHIPVSCDLVKKWLEVSGETIRNNLWIVNNTKPCPKCETRIERTEGCNHMKCGNCHFEFCWMCMQDWANHAGMFFNCVRFKPSNDEKHSGKATAAKLRHYAARFDSNSSQSQKQLDESDLSFSSRQAKYSAEAALSNARRILAWTYVLLFYTLPSNQKSIVESSVSEVESCAESLAEALSADDISLSSRCIELTDHLDSRTIKLRDHVLEVTWKYDKSALAYRPKQTDN